ncbi:MAG: DNA repair protein RecN [bacterium]|nr:DNA repair protein RecN [bacterium]
MLKQLRIENFTIIDYCELDFGPSLTMLTGETGAGKSIIVDAISLLLGRTASDEMIKTSKKQAVIEGVFDASTVLLSPELKEILDEDKEIIVYRRLVKGKGSMVRVNGQTITLKTLKTIMKPLAGIIGQHEHLELFNSDMQLSLLDSFAEEELKGVKSRYQDCFRKYKDICHRLDAGQQGRDEIAQRIELLSLQVLDIEQHSFQPGEELDLEKKRKEIRNSRKIKMSLSAVQGKFEEVMVLISESGSHLEQILDIDQFFVKTKDYLDSVSIELEDKLKTIRSQADHLDDLDALDIDHIESRLDVIFKYKNKYKVKSIDDLVNLSLQLQHELKELESVSSSTEGLESSYETTLAELSDLALDLHNKRKVQAGILSQHIQSKMEGLNFDNCEFEIKIEYCVDSFFVTGATKVDFMISVNKGEPLKPLQKVSSGGELSRIMLAVKTVFFKYNPVGTLIFDEIDAGVGGITAVKLGEYMKIISQYCQVFCVTHLPQIAKFADEHYLVNKYIQDNESRTNVKLLQGEEKSQELHRMVGGKEVVELIKPWIH